MWCCGQAGLSRTVLAELLWSSNNEWAQTIVFQVCLSTITCKRKADQMFAYLHAELCCLWQKTWLALQTPICKIWSSMLAVWAHCWCKLKLGMFGSLKAIMLASSPLSLFFLDWNWNSVCNGTSGFWSRWVAHFCLKAFPLRWPGEVRG